MRWLPQAGALGAFVGLASRGEPHIPPVSPFSGYREEDGFPPACFVGTAYARGLEVAVLLCGIQQVVRMVSVLSRRYF